ncbi:P1 family peptidase [Lentibacillus saliphilus]|uniref:DmpA family aminopeptidase n=1 Tax=Lentibacillus saliphilus TaxID=2737028 RepID=UPI001C30B4D6|nr:P1 family peptidase [Lentibacillus saliphilus]
MQLEKGPHNCITDVLGVKVGHVTIEQSLPDSERVCTGITAILPHGNDLFSNTVPAASHVINGFGKSVGLVQLDELGQLESPIMLTNTFSVGAVLQGTLQYMLQKNDTIGDTASSLNVVVGECNDSYLNSMRHMAVTPEHAIQAIESAHSGPVEQGAVGAGKGMICFGYKGGIGSASRIVPTEEDGYTVGCLVLTNFGKPEHAQFAQWSEAETEPADGSIMIILATDAPLYDRQLKRLAKRTTAGLARTGSIIAHGSGDIAIAFSTANTHQKDPSKNMQHMSFIPDDSPVMNNLFQAVVETTEAAIMNALSRAETTVGRKGRVVQKAPLPHDCPDY